MKSKNILTLLLAALSMVYAADDTATAVETNPVGGQSVNNQAPTGGINIADIRVRDPFIFADQVSKTYYLYAQCGNRQNNDNLGLGVEVYSSKDLVTWSAPVLANGHIYMRNATGDMAGLSVQ